MLTFLLNTQLPAKTLDLKVLPTRISDWGSDQGLKISSPMPCGHSFMGALLSSKLGKVAALYNRPKLTCSKLSAFKNHHITAITTTLPQVTWTPKIQWWERLQVVPVLSATQSKLGTSVTYVTKCGRSLGLLATPSGKTTKIAMVEALPKDQNGCHEVVVEKIFPGLKITNSKSLQLERQKPTKLAIRKFAWVHKRADILRGHSTNTLIARYERKCNEAPIGYSVKSRGATTEVGVIVAKYFNFKCHPNSPKRFKSKLKITALAKSNKVIGRKLTSSTAFQLIPLLKSKNTKNRTYFSFPPSCKIKRDFLVFTERSGKLLVAKASHRKSCEKPRKTNISQPLQVHLPPALHKPLITPASEIAH